MSTTISLIQRVQIASPCTTSWDEMVGDEKSRFCSHCKLNVYNLSAMPQEEAEQLIIAKEGTLCARVYRRSDGTILTRDCPRGLAAIRHRAVKWAFKVAAAVIGISGTTAAVVFDNAAQPAAGASFFARTTQVIRNWLNATPPSPPAGWLAGAIMVSPLPPSPAQSGASSTSN
jgi:hypothetical protein